MGWQSRFESLLANKAFEDSMDVMYETMFVYSYS